MGAVRLVVSCSGVFRCATLTGSHCPLLVHQSVVQPSEPSSAVSVAVVAALVAAVDAADTTVTGDGGASAALSTPGTGTAVAGMGYDTIEKG